MPLAQDSLEFAVDLAIMESAHTMKSSSASLKSDNNPQKNPQKREEGRWPFTCSLAFVGMMGVGKSSLGRLLAKRYGLEFRDTDREIQRAADMSISEIFEYHGEDFFRDGERRVIRRVMRELARPAVIALGGGSFLDSETRALLKEHAVTVWLDGTPELLIERLARHPDRPLIAGKTKTERQEKIKTLLAERNPIYALADVCVKADTGPPEETLARVCDCIVEYAEKATDLQKIAHG